jgi:hypothetical protein
MDSALGQSDAVHMDAVRYVAFCNILGFSNRILADFETALSAYRQFGELISDPKFALENVQATLYSDAVLIALHAAVGEGQPLIPPDIFTRFIREGILKH